MFADRAAAGRQLGALLARRDDLPVPGTVVLGLPRGGVVVAAAVADSLGAPLDVIVVRKLGVPGHSELAMGAVGEDGRRVLDPVVVERLGIGEEDVARVEARERAVLDARTRRLRRDRPRTDLTGRVALVVDDGVATGASAAAACQVARALGAARVLLAVPVAPPRSLTTLLAAEGGPDEVVALSRPEPFVAVGAHYADFRPVTDDEVGALLRARPPSGARSGSVHPQGRGRRGDPGLP